MKKTAIQMLKELRVLSLIYLISVIALFVLCYLYKQNIYTIIAKPLMIATNETYVINDISRIFIYTSIWESFATDMKLSSYTALFFSLPILFYCVYCFIAKSLYENEKKIAKILFLSSIILSCIAIAVTYFLILPRVINFFIVDANTFAKPMLKISEYVSTLFCLMLSIITVFHLPLVLIGLVKFKVLSKKALSKNRRIAIVVIFIISAIITPPDVLSQIICAFMLMMMYEITNFIIKKIC